MRLAVFPLKNNGNIEQPDRIAIWPTRIKGFPRFTDAEGNSRVMLSIDGDEDVDSSAPLFHELDMTIEQACAEANDALVSIAIKP